VLNSGDFGIMFPRFVQLPFPGQASWPPAPAQYYAPFCQKSGQFSIRSEFCKTASGYIAVVLSP
jgi:hypothetical protein